MIMTGIAVPVVLFATGMWSPIRWGMYLDAMREVAPMSFYGKVVDDAGQPLEGVRVMAEITKPNEAYIFGVGNLLRRRTFGLTTNAQGEFQIVGHRGRSIRFREFEKSGYTFVPRIKGGGNWDTSFYFAGGGVGRAGPHKPDAKNPVLFDMRKK